MKSFNNFCGLPYVGAGEPGASTGHRAIRSNATDQHSEQANQAHHRWHFHYYPMADARA